VVFRPTARRLLVRFLSLFSHAPQILLSPISSPTVSSSSKPEEEVHSPPLCRWPPALSFFPSPPQLAPASFSGTSTLTLSQLSASNFFPLVPHFASVPKKLCTSRPLRKDVRSHVFNRYSVLHSFPLRQRRLPRKRSFVPYRHFTFDKIPLTYHSKHLEGLNTVPPV